MLRFDHLVIAVRDLSHGIARYRDALGLDAQPGGRHTGRGTENGIVRFGLDYLELISIFDYDEAMAAGRGTLADFLRRHEGGPVAYALATDDIDALAGRVRKAGLDVVGPFAMERVRPDGSKLSWRLVVPGADQYRRPWPFFIQWDQPDEERLAHETPGSNLLGAYAVDEVAVVVEALDDGVRLYAEQLGLALTYRDQSAELRANRAIFDLGSFRIVLLAPTGDGPVRDVLQAMGEGPFHTVLSVRDLDAARRWLESAGTEVEPAPASAGGLLIRPARALNSRLILRQRS